MSLQGCSFYPDAEEAEHGRRAVRKVTGLFFGSPSPGGQGTGGGVSRRFASFSEISCARGGADRERRDSTDYFVAPDDDWRVLSRQVVRLGRRRLVRCGGDDGLSGSRDVKRCLAGLLAITRSRDFPLYFVARNRRSFPIERSDGCLWIGGLRGLAKNGFGPAFCHDTGMVRVVSPPV